MTKKLFTLCIILSISSVSMASNARIATMGGTDFYFQDNTALFRNPALISQNSGYLMGDLGIYHNPQDEDSDDSGDKPEYTNTDPLRPYFGGTYYAGSAEDKSGLYVGAAFNRYDVFLDYLLPESDKFLGSPQSSRRDWSDIEYLQDVRGKIDLLAAYRFTNGFTVGASGYLAMQDSTYGSNYNQMTRLAKGTFGVHGEITQDIDLDASVGVAAMVLDGHYPFARNVETETMYNDISVTIDARLFAQLNDLQTFVPHIQANIITFDSDEQITDFNAGFGITNRIDRGFFWTGLEGFYINNSRSGIRINSDEEIVYGKENEYGGKVMVGIERNMLTDWLVWRAGATQKLSLVTYNDGDDGEFFNGNEDRDKYGKAPTISFGLGLNFEDRLYVDAVIAEDLFYTFGNIFSGNLGHITSHISAGFDF
ncbi:MAG: hypothetical protein ACQEQ4_04775 [Fibrobacterota bacterium]